jgi:hypothetical protein
LRRHLSEATRKFAHKTVELAIAFRIAKIDDLQPKRAQAGSVPRDASTPRMGAGEAFKELAFLRPGKVANFENYLEMRGRYWHRIDRVRYLRNKASVLPERCRESLAGARRPAIQDVAKDALVGLNARRLCVARRL